MKCTSCGRIMLLALVRGGGVCDSCTRAALLARQRADEQMQAELEVGCYEDLRVFIGNSFTQQDVIDTLATYKGHGLRDTLGPRLRLYMAAADHAAADRCVTADEYRTLANLRSSLMLSAEDTASVDANLHRIDMFGQLDRGELPVLSNAGVPLQRNEVGRFRFEGVAFLQERVTHRERVGTSQGVSIRLCRGVSYRVGASRGHTITHTGLVTLDSGDLLLTSKRLIYAGSQKGFSIPLGKILDVTPYSDGLSITKDSNAMNAKPYVFTHHDAEYLNAAFSACWNAA